MLFVIFIIEFEDTHPKNKEVIIKSKVQTAKNTQRDGIKKEPTITMTATGNSNPYFQDSIFFI